LVFFWLKSGLLIPVVNSDADTYTTIWNYLLLYAMDFASLMYCCIKCNASIEFVMKICWQGKERCTNIKKIFLFREFWSKLVLVINTWIQILIWKWEFFQ
jgi:hypothetical protein